MAKFDLNIRKQRKTYFSYLFDTYREAISDVSATIIHIAKGVIKSSAAPNSIPGGNPIATPPMQ